MDFEDHIIKTIEQQTKLRVDKLEIPPDPKLGDYAFPCYPLASKLKKDPAEIAKDLKDKIKPDQYITEIKVVGPYLNFFINKCKLAEDTISTILKQKEKYGSADQKQTIMIEFCAPNTNKPLHLGHLRNISLGDSIARILSFLGNKVIKANLVNDRGVHICKSMLAYQKWGNGKQPDKKSDHFVGDFYVLYSKKANDDLERETQEMLRRWEAGDKETVALWEQMNKWALDGFKETFQRLGISFDITYLESNIYKKGKAIVEKALKQNQVSKDEEGKIIVDLETFNLGRKVLLRSDGTSVYLTQDLALAEQKFTDYPLDKSIYVVGSEQNIQFRQLFEILRIIKSKAADRSYHLSYGLVHLPEGRMKSREGTVVDADDLLDQIESLAVREITMRDKDIDNTELRLRAAAISQGALRYELLKVDAIRDITYDPKKGMSFEGDTGPYIQYAHARICSILRKEKLSIKLNLKLLVDPTEIKLIKKLSEFPSTVAETGISLKPHMITNYLIELSQDLSEFYHNCPVLKAETELKNARLALITAVKHILSNGLQLLGIIAPERM